MSLMSLRIIPTLSFPITPIIPIGPNLPKFTFHFSLFTFHLSVFSFALSSFLSTQPPPTHPLNCLKKCKKIFKNPFFVSIFVVQSGQNLFSRAV